jgi:ribose/xylose/arabinose/galactoside ABC-type transport system permease subunit
MKNITKKWNSPDMKYIFPWLLFIISFTLMLIQNHGNFGQRTSESLNWLIIFGTPYLLFAMGAGLVLSTGGVDVSFVGVSALSGVLSAATFGLTNSIFLSTLSGLFFGIISGIIVGLLISKRFAPSLLVTWAIGMIWFTISVVISKHIKIDNVTTSVSGIELINFPKFINYPFTIALFLFILIQTLNYSGLTKKTRAIGANRDSAIYAGVNVTKTEFLVYIINSLLASIAGIFWMTVLDRAQTEPFIGQEIIGIAIAVLGGTVMSGGYLNLFSIVASTFFYITLEKLTKSVNIGIADEQHWVSIALAFVFLLVTLFFGKKINGTTTPVHIDRNTQN